MGAPKGAKPVQKVRKVNGAVVIRALYNGKALGWGKYFSGLVNNQLVVDDQGKPLYYEEIGVLE